MGAQGDVHFGITPSQSSEQPSKPLLTMTVALGCFIFRVRVNHRISKSVIINESGRFHTHQQVLAISRQSASAVTF